ncbi:VOC family protein [Miltoncostaea marina]|uniref:VOC family protein n=1 Tax=Miltoncostaea marina TaxID=2843215 RepID=UPI001C3D106F|nr:VOC family protein [Miltoncostaea marina]
MSATMAAAAVATHEENRTVLPPRLSVVTLFTDDVPGLRRFYEGLGWPHAGPPRDDHAAFTMGGAALALWTLDEAGPEVVAPVRALGHPAPTATLAVNVRSGEEVDAAVEAARRAGATIVTEPEDKPWGGRSAVFCDPGGTAWEVTWAPGATVGDEPAVRWGHDPA